jgi:hypothetical protein
MTHRGVSPLIIKLMLAYYVSPKPETCFKDGEWNSSAATEGRRWLAENGLVDNSLRCTEKGNVWCARICATPLPVQQWI